MRKKRSVNLAVLKHQEVSRVQQVNWISAILFGLISCLYIAGMIFAFDIIDALIGFFFMANFAMSVRGIRELNAFNQKLLENPNEYATKPIKRPLLYRAVFWYLPK